MHLHRFCRLVSVLAAAFTASAPLPSTASDYMIEGSDLVEAGRSFEAELRFQVLPGASVREVLDVLGAPLASEEVDGDRFLVWEHEIAEFSWRGVGGNGDWQATRKDAIAVGRVFNALQFGSVAATATDASFRATETEVAIEQMTERVVRRTRYEFERLRVQFNGTASGDRVGGWVFTESGQGTRRTETSAWVFADPSRIDVDREKTTESSDQSERLDNPEAHRLRVVLGRQLDEAGITDPAVRKRMIEDALRAKGLIP
jgi:hypothetical protein